MTVNISPSKFDICLLSGVLFNFACVTANYWPTTPAYGPPPGPPGSSMSNIYSDPVRIMGSYPSSSPYYPPNYSYSSRMDPSSYGPALPPPRSDPYYSTNSISGSSSRYPSPPGPSGYGYSYSMPAPVVSSGYQSSYQRYPSYPTTSTSLPYYYRPNPSNPYASSNQIPYQYWRTPPVSQYDAFDRRGGVYGVPSSAYQQAGSPIGGGGYPPMSPYGPPDYYGPRTAYAKLKSAKPDSKVEGEVRFVQQDNRYVGITGRVVGLIPGAHGLHVHEGVEKDGSCENIGGHFNPMNSEHGGKSEWKRHVGDLGNVFADQDGVAYFSIIDSLISLTGPNSVLNRTLVITEFGDDLGKGADQSKVNGNAGKPITCGVISLTG